MSTKQELGSPINGNGEDARRKEWLNYESGGNNVMKDIMKVMVLLDKKHKTLKLLGTTIVLERNKDGNGFVIADKTVLFRKLQGAGALEQDAEQVVHSFFLELERLIDYIGILRINFSGKYTVAELLDKINVELDK